MSQPEHLSLPVMLSTATSPRNCFLAFAAFWFSFSACVNAQQIIPQQDLSSGKPWNFEYSTHLKYRYQYQKYPEESFYQLFYDDSNQRHLVENRWKFSADKERWDFKLDYRLVVLDSEDRLQTSPIFMGGQTGLNSTQQLLDLTKMISDDENTQVLHQLDRLNVGYTGDNLSLRVGRQVVSWGNGLLFNPMDFFNPFSPVALDTEYKPGEDMIYSQYLFDSGNDLQFVSVMRRDARGEVDAEEFSYASKLHVFLSEMELDFMLSRHFSDVLAGIGLVNSIGGSVVRGDLMITKTESETVHSLVTNVSYSWVWGDTNFSGSLEYFYNGLGVDLDNTDLNSLSAHPDLIARLNRGELYTLGKHSLAATATVELTPLLLLSPALLVNVQDPSAFMQISASYDISQNCQLTGAVSFPVGPEGTEYGGIAIGSGDYNLSSREGLYLQIAYYF